MQDVGAAAPVLAQFRQVLAFPFDLPAVGVEYLRIGVAESVDRLVDVAHGVESILGPQQVEQLRLQSVRILEFVHQHMVELTADALARLGILLEQPHGELFQIGEIERASIGFAVTV